MKKVLCTTMAMMLFLCSVGCSDAGSSGADRRKVESIPFEEDQLYAVAYLLPLIFSYTAMLYLPAPPESGNVSYLPS